MKLSFSIPSKSSSKSNNKPSPTTTDDPPSTSSKHLITEFDPSKAPSTEAKTVISPIQNQWRPLKRMKNLELPITDPNNTESLQFENDTSSANRVEPGSDMSYGLNLRQTGNNNNDDDKHDYVSNRVTPPQRVSAETVLLQKLKDDLNSLPEDRGFDEFKDVPVEGFGAALLAGYGWTEGMGIGKNAKEDVKVKQYEKRAAKEGLGFIPKDRASMRRKKEEKEERRRGENGNRDVGFGVGKSVRVVGGRDFGLKGSVVRRIGDDSVVLKVSRNGEEVKVRVDDLAEVGSVEEERFLRKSKESRDRHGGGDKSKRGREESEVEEMRVGVEEMRVGVDRSSLKEEQGRKRVAWLSSHIRVRVISRDLKGGRLYLKKGEVLDVVGPTTCDISMDESKEIIQGVSQDLLETAIPRRGGPVLVLYGKYKGAYGILVERDLDQQIGVVRDADTHELLNVKLEQIAEYIGDPSFLGH